MHSCCFYSSCIDMQINLDLLGSALIHLDLPGLWLSVKCTFYVQLLTVLLCTIYMFMRITQCIIYIVHIVQCTVYSVHYILYIVQYTVHSIQSTMYILHSTMIIVCSVHNVQREIMPVHLYTTICTPYSV